MMVRNSDALVIGGGPAGSAAAAVLAGEGRDVVLLERELFPRYHIGESLLPYCYFPLERIGMIGKMKASQFVRKYSVQFVNTEGKLSVPFYFYQQMDHEASMTWQVLRSEFDGMLLDNARERGADVRQGVTARELLREAGAVKGVCAMGPDGVLEEFRAPITIDATGRDAFAVSRNGWKVRDPHLNKIAIWTYYKGAMRDPGLDEGATTVAFVPGKGWFWYIPLQGDIVSVGIVAEKNYLYSESRDLATIFRREIGRNKWIEDHVAPGTQTGQHFVTGEFSYRSRHCAEDGLVLAGDAFGFLDPVFSSGVFLALQSGVMAGEAVHAALSANDVAAERFRDYGAHFCEGIESMRKLVYGFYDPKFSFKDFLMEYPGMKGDLTECLIGNVFRDFDAMFAAMSKFADIPGPLPYGAPLVRNSEMAETGSRA
jgi:flavin-dependent dehydrogenase